MYALLKLLQWTLCLIPESLMGAFSRFWGFVVGSIFFYRRKVVIQNLSQAFPELSPAEQKRVRSGFYTHIIRTFTEFLRIPKYQKQGLMDFVEVEGLEHALQAREQGKGVLVLSGHLGSFELAVAAFGKDLPISLVVKPFSKAMDRLVRGIRQGTGLKVIYAEGAARGVLKALRKNEYVVFVLDQNATRKIGVFVDFFGKQASTMAGLATLAKRSGAPVIAAIPHRREDGKHILKVLPPIVCDAEASVEEMTQTYTKIVEEAIRQHPHQWFWTHKRWRTQPK